MPHEIGTANDSSRSAQPRSRFSRLALDRVTAGAFALGALTVAGFAPFYLYPLPILTLGGLLLMWRRAGSGRRAAAIGWWFGLGFFLFGVSWVYVSLNTFGAMPAPI